jgi:hypothetical protein
MQNAELLTVLLPEDDVDVGIQFVQRIRGRLLGKFRLEHGPIFFPLVLHGESIDKAVDKFPASSVDVYVQLRNR